MKSYIGILCMAVLSASGISQNAYRIETGKELSKDKHQGRCENVVRELRMSGAQKEEIQSIVSSMKNDTRTFRRKLEALREDYAVANLKDKVDEKEVMRILDDIQHTKAEINGVALKKMAEIKQLLTSAQTSKLKEMRKAELDRIERMNKDEQGDAAVDNQPRMPKAQTFSISSWSSSGDDKTFSPDEVFVYPDRELWIDSPFMSTFSLGGNDRNIGRIPLMNEFFGGDINGLNFDLPRFKHFEFRNSPDDDDDDEEAMQDSPGNEPRDKNSVKPRDEKRLRQQIEELRNKLKRLEQRMEDKDR